MSALLEWARGPAFVFSLSFMLLGLLRHLLLTIWEMRRTMRRAGDRTLPYRQLVLTTAKWLVPISKLRRQPLFSTTSIAFHLCILIVPFALAGHVELWASATGMRWPVIGNSLADILSLIAIFAALALVVQRVAFKTSRGLSRLSDYLMPPLVALPFVTGFLFMHANLHSLSYETMFLIHIMSANLLMILIPITRLSHAVLLPSLQLLSEMGWHWPMDAGSRVARALGKEGEAV